VTRFCSRLASVAVVLAIVLFPLRVPATTTTTVTAGTNPIVMWNAQTTGTLTLFPNYVASTGMTNSSGTGSVVTATNSGFTGGGCTASPAQTSNIIDFSRVIPPTAGNTTACDYQNALSIEITTNDTNGFTLSEELGLAPGTGFTLCSLPNDTTFVKSTALPLGASTATSTSASINETSCAGANQVTLGSGNTTPTATSGSQTGSGTYFIGQDVLLLITSSTVALQSYSATLTVTLTLN
jgi:hypothetical protein